MNLVDASMPDRDWIYDLQYTQKRKREQQKKKLKIPTMALKKCKKLKKGTTLGWLRW
jgi:hypothetical protein